MAKQAELTIKNLSSIITKAKAKSLLPNWVLRQLAQFTHKDFTYLDNIDKGEAISSIITEINRRNPLQKNTDRILEMFAEMDAAKKLIGGGINGEHKDVKYGKTGGQKSCDFISHRAAIEVKALSPKIDTFDKFLKKCKRVVITDAIRQIHATSKKFGLKEGIIFIQTHQSFTSKSIYGDRVVNYFTKNLELKNLEQLSIFIFLFAENDIWDFYLP